MKITVLIPTHKRNVLLSSLLDSLSDAVLPEVVEAVYVIENGSHESEGLVASYSERGYIPLRYVHFEEGNKSAALNQVIEGLSDASFLLFLDDDVTICPDYFVRYEAALRTHAEGHYYGGPVEAFYEEAPDPDLLMFMPVSSIAFKKPYLQPTISDSATFLGCNWGCYKSSLSLIGGFNRELGPGAGSTARGQETDAQQRLFSRGLKPVYVPEATVYHFVPAKHLTKDWIFQRVYQSGIKVGITNKSVANAAGWLVKLLILKLQRLLDRRNLKTEFRIMRYQGRMQGYFHKRGE